MVDQEIVAGRCPPPLRLRRRFAGASPLHLLHQQAVVQFAVLPVILDDEGQEFLQFPVFELQGPLLQFLQVHGLGLA